ncbi:MULTISPECIES: NAD(P)H-dependent flavin oxidoreductase [Gammaproteobacteria]|jgi:nitronate monooxygenase|uniref:Nitronate monooxygenase n=2 Tax=Marinobacter nauticus TaxID=2743 RepID=A1U864_MARN8|nr:MULTISPECIES: nitronate monooxygenase [Gammaproteobacteria]ABM21183.1 2-nitropropane dioxygenase, NPD [Marinobacter nauticus VT8]MBU73740.1 nitronate monooxygenase [Spongiibacter sp.]HAC29907.1 nitronate monooxygenase [Marinobacter nauticus]|tara:strand:+ start:1586 stop:2626 length:1041 start_codon:yes stop_codon:yes gene_type:complete
MTTLRELLNVDYPVIQAPMAGVQDSALTIAVSKAGGLGSLPCGMLTGEKILEEVASIRAATDRTFNLNFFCHIKPPEDPGKEAAWRQRLQPYYEELGLELNKDDGGASRRPFDEQTAELVAELKPAVVSFHFGLPAPDLLAYIKSNGVKVLASATTLAEALWLEQRGADAIIAQGLEAGGHRGHFLSDDLGLQLGTFALLPQITSKVKLPVIAAGGIASAEGVKAAIQLGAVAAQVGTAYLLCTEAKTSAIHRDALQSEQASHTEITNVFSGRPARGIVNRLMRDQGAISSSVPDFPNAAAALAPLRSEAEKLGKADFSPLWAGQNTMGCKEISAGKMTLKLASVQ